MELTYTHKGAWYLTIYIFAFITLIISNFKHQTMIALLLFNFSEEWPQHMELPYEIFNITTTYVGPLAILCFTYSVVARKLWGRSLPGNADHLRDISQAKAKRKVSISIACDKNSLLSAFFFYSLID